MGVLPRSFILCRLHKDRAVNYLPKCHKYTVSLTIDRRRQIEEKWKDYVSSPGPVNKPLEEAVGDGRNSKYILSMFPYPSGNLHMGHVRVYTITDVWSRYHRMAGHEVIHPMGWDAFGLPAENAAIDKGISPAKWTNDNIASMKEQMLELVCNFDWSREIRTCDPSYYRWTQYIFLKLYDAGLAYQRKAAVNWDPVDKTVLANEQVDSSGISWRSGAKVEKRYLNQWFINVEKYAEELYNDLSKLRNWNEQVVKLQQGWLKKPLGCRIDLTLLGDDISQSVPDVNKLTVHIKSPEAIAAAAFVTVTGGHYLDDGKLVSSVTDGEKLLKVKAKSPFCDKLLPIYVSDSIQYGFQCDSHLGVPVLKEADAEYARARGIPFSTDVRSHLITSVFPVDVSGLSDTELGEAVQRVAQSLGIGGYSVSKYLPDWLISRQRYWGTPIPMLHCGRCGPVPVPYDQLPVVLPEIHSRSALGTAMESPLVNADAGWLYTDCPNCGSRARRETDTMDTYVDSSWYYLRYLDPGNERELVGKTVADRNLPVDYYIGGKEHATAHLYYARFIHKFLRDEGVVSCGEPFNTMVTQGQVKAKSYKVVSTGKYIAEEHVDVSNFDEAALSGAVERDTGLAVEVRWEKMSKSKLNGVNPRDIITQYGSDLTRLFIMADVPGKTERKWDRRSFEYIENLTLRLYDMVCGYKDIKEKHTADTADTGSVSVDTETEIKQERNNFIKDVTKCLVDLLEFNACLWRILRLTKFLKKQEKSVYLSSREFEVSLATLLITLAPFAPHLAAELWSVMSSAPHKLTGGVAAGAAGAASVAGVTSAAGASSAAGAASTAVAAGAAYHWEEGVFGQRWPTVDRDCAYLLVPVLDGTGLHPVGVSHHYAEELAQDPQRAFTTALIRPRNASKLLPARDNNNINRLWISRSWRYQKLFLHVVTNEYNSETNKGKKKKIDNE